MNNEQVVIQQILDFLRTTFSTTGKTKGIVAVSGGIDSAVSLTLLTQALGSQNVYPIMLPYGDQSTADSRAVIEFNQIPKENLREVNIQPMVESYKSLVASEPDELRLGNAMARIRMIIIYDLAKQLDALVCGTENKSEMYLGYFTRFGDEASDIEPIQHLFKTEIRELAKHLGVPESIQTKAPSAGLWEGQTDETEMSFTYHDADQVFTHLEQINQISSLYDVRTSSLEFRKKVSDELGIELSVLERVLEQVKKNHFKHVVPYKLEKQKAES